MNSRPPVTESLGVLSLQAAVKFSPQTCVGMAHSLRFSFDKFVAKMPQHAIREPHVSFASLQT